jgi:hypothetical protein
MRILGHTSKAEREAMLARLYELRNEARSPHVRQRVDSYIMYAEIGKDRKKLGMDWAERAEKAVEEAKAFDELMASIGKGA